MKIKKLYTYIGLAICTLLFATACQQDALSSVYDETASLTLQFDSPAMSITRGVGDGTLRLYYEAKDGKIIPCEAPDTLPLSRAVGDGNTADGGGMADLAVFLVDVNDKIVAREKLSSLENLTTRTINLLNLKYCLCLCKYRRKQLVHYSC